ncbi:MAG: glycosyltransferase family 4 protein [Alphaproteobacteria bacterium]
MRVLFVCRAISNVAGGVERMAVSIMNELVERGHDVSILTWDVGDEPAFYQMDERIVWRRIDLGTPTETASVGLRLKRALKVRQIVGELKPDVALAFQYGCFISLKLYGAGIRLPIIAAERNAPSLYDFTSAGERRNRIFQSMRLADRITVQCESYRDMYPTYLRDKIVIIPNPVFPATGRAAPAGEGASERILLSVGRLSYQKNQHALLRAFATLRGEFPGWRLEIAGDGEEQDSLERLIGELGFGDEVRLLGAVKDVNELYCRSHLFCLSSRWEGFPNALAEAMARGLPAVGYADCCGTNELIVNGQTGQLAGGNGDTDSLAAALRQLMSDDAGRAAMGESAVSAMLSYQPQSIFDRWEGLLADVAGRPLASARAVDAAA